MVKSIALLIVLSLVAGCNTFEGMGRDVESATNWVMGEDDGDIYARQPMNQQYPSNQPVQQQLPYYYQ